MEKKACCSHGLTRSSSVHLAIFPLDQIRLKPGKWSRGAFNVDGQYSSKNSIIDVVKEKLFTMPNNVVVYATEMAKRSLVPRQFLE